MSIVHLIKRWVADPVENTALQVPRALVASALAFGLNLAVVVLLVESLGMHPVAAEVVGYLAGGFLQYALCLVWVFPATDGGHATGFLTFLVLSLLGLPITSAVMVGGEWFHIPYPLAVFVSQGITFVWNFMSRKLLLFRPAT